MKDCLPCFVGEAPGCLLEGGCSIKGVLIKKLLTCTDSIVVEALKVLNRVAIETCFPCNPTIQGREGRLGGGAFLRGVYVWNYDQGGGHYSGECVY